MKHIRLVLFSMILATAATLPLSAMNESNSMDVIEPSDIYFQVDGFLEGLQEIAQEKTRSRRTRNNNLEFHIQKALYFDTNDKLVLVSIILKQVKEINIQHPTSYDMAILSLLQLIRRNLLQEAALNWSQADTDNLCTWIDNEIDEIKI